MAGITAAELLAQKQAEYRRDRVTPNEFYAVKIIDSDVRVNKFGGESLRLIFEFEDERFAGNHISHILTFRNANRTYSPQFVDLVALFFDLSISTTKIDTDELVGKKCQILVEDNPKQPRWQRVTKILSVSGN